MKPVVLKLIIDPQIYEATRQFMEDKGLNLEDFLQKSVEKSYKKYVPATVRKYIERRESAQVPPRPATAGKSESGIDNRSDLNEITSASGAFSENP